MKRNEHKQSTWFASHRGRMPISLRSCLLPGEVVYSVCVRPHHGNGNGTSSVIQSRRLTADPLPHTTFMDCHVLRVIYKIDIGLYFHLIRCLLWRSSNINWWALVCCIFIGDFWAMGIEIPISLIRSWKYSGLFLKWDLQNDNVHSLLGVLELW